MMLTSSCVLPLHASTSSLLPACHSPYFVCLHGNQGLPRKVVPRCSLLHNEVVCAVAINQSTKHIYTGGKVCCLCMCIVCFFVCVYTMY